MGAIEEEMRGLLRPGAEQRLEVKLADMFLGEEISLNLWQFSKLLLDKIDLLENAVLTIGRTLDEVQSASTRGGSEG